ncbi:Uncharacterized protein FWK35_00034086, partial [Aphis craccivora]
KIISLNNRFRLLDLTFLFILLYNHINCPELIKFLNFYVNFFNCRNKPVFYPLNASNIYNMYSPANKLMLSGNFLCNIDLFHTYITKLMSSLYL